MDGLSASPSEHLTAAVAGSFPCKYEQSLGVIASRANALITSSIRQDLFYHLESTRSLFETTRASVVNNPGESCTNADLIAAIELSGKHPIEGFEYFALNTFLEIENVLHILSIPADCFVDYDPLDSDNIHRTECQLSIVAATESVTFAENLLRTSQKARVAANKRHEPVRALKLAFIEYRQSKNDNLSTIEHARRYLKNLPRDERCGLSLENGAITLSRAYGKYIKNGGTL